MGGGWLRGKGSSGKEKGTSDRGREVERAEGGEKRVERHPFVGREVPSGRVVLRPGWARKGDSFQPLEGKVERCAAEALRVGDIGVPASFFCHTDQRKCTYSLSREEGAVSGSTF